jgi:hypothetical protein
MLEEAVALKAECERIMQSQSLPDTSNAKYIGRKALVLIGEKYLSLCLDLASHEAVSHNDESKSV